jgi:four helix bundle protein
MAFTRFEDIQVWQKSKTLAKDIYNVFEDESDYSFQNQVRRASLSIMNNIAEGFERQTGKEFRQLLYIAKGSCAEVKSMLYISVELSKITEEQFENLVDQAVVISKMLTRLIQSICVD